LAQVRLESPQFSNLPSLLGVRALSVERSTRRCPLDWNMSGNSVLERQLLMRLKPSGV
jgi:hypothetical protein